MTELAHSPLDAAHRALGARLVEFGGWEMPIQYTGVLDEHRSCRADAVVFDVSHLGSIRVTGSRGLDVLQRAFTNDLERIGPGRAQYTHLLDPVDAHVVDDIIVWWVGESDWLVMPNASNTAGLIAALHEEAAEGGGDVVITDITRARAVLAIQGPHARERVATVDPQFGAVARFGVAAVRWNGTECIVAGTGYTGEDGVEIHVPAAASTELWDAVLAAGVTPAGLGARDTLRLEAGLPLHGHELGQGITPLQANLAWVVRFGKGPFRGSEALAAEQERGIARRLRGIALAGRRPVRQGDAVSVDGDGSGVVTSGNFSPTLGHAIALAFVPPEVEPDAEVTVDSRGQSIAGCIVPLPFVRSAAR